MKIAIIPARGGSKRIPRKNIRSFAGQPIMTYSIKAAVRSGCFDRIIVSTDDEEMAEVARSSGAEVPFMRPAQLADDHTILGDVICHTIDLVEAQGHPVAAACCIFATAPFVSSGGIQHGLTALQAGGKAFSISVTSFPSAVQRALRMQPDGSLDAMYPEFRQTRSQDLEAGWHDAGQFCWGTRDAFMQRLAPFAPHSVGVVLPRHLVQDLDTLEDWHRAELMYEVLHRSGELPS
jgi:N-acylneuraminate cytidylyltransferase